jgi:hypothetical protein
MFVRPYKNGTYLSPESQIIVTTVLSGPNLEASWRDALKAAPEERPA